MNIDELQEFAHEFDINPDINFKLLLYLQKNKNAEYRRYIEKYKYTLKFNYTLKLKCLGNKYIDSMRIEFNKNVEYGMLK